MVGLAENKATQPSLAGAWAELGKSLSAYGFKKKAFSKMKKSSLNERSIINEEVI